MLNNIKQKINHKLLYINLLKGTSIFWGGAHLNHLIFGKRCVQLNNQSPCILNYAGHQKSTIMKNHLNKTTKFI